MEKGVSRMTYRILKKGGLALTKTFKGTLFISSFFILAWIAYCLTCLTVDWFSYCSDDCGEDTKIVVVKC
jgi:hypothetical protein